MSDTHASLNTGPSLGAMARIETIRLARNPFFIIANLVSFGFLVYFLVAGESRDLTTQDLLSWPVVPAFFVGLTSLVVLARQTRSTEAAAEAMSAAPGSESQRTAALVLACLLPAAHGLVWAITEVVSMHFQDVPPEEWWFGNVNDVRVWAMLLGSTAVACFGGALLGVLVGRWLGFPGAPAVVVVALVVVDMIAQGALAASSAPVARLWAPWIMWYGGTETDNTAQLYAGNAGFSLIYLLCLCAVAIIAATWHDRAARTTQLKRAIVVTAVVGLAALALSMTTGDTHNHVSPPAAERSA